MAKSSRANGKASAAKQKDAQTGSLPLFFKNPHPLHEQRHAQAGLKLLDHFGFAAHTNSIALNVVEFFEAARSYPIVFTASGKVMPVALLGIQDRNCFIDKNGHWLRRCYIPAYVRRYPFIFMEDAEQDKFILCVDESAPHYSSDAPEKRFFDEKGEMSEFSRHALQFCALYQQHHMHTVAFCEALIEQELLVEKAMTMRLPDGKEVALSGFRVLDTERFQSLPDAVYLEWRHKGWIAALDAVLLSYTNWKYLAELLAEPA